MANYYVASCLFTARFPETSLRIQNYIRTKPDIKTVRCCIPNFKVDFNTNRIPSPSVRQAWEQLPVSEVFQPDDTVISVCHNCTNIAEEWRAGTKAVSLWEIIDRDPSFVFPDYDGMEVTVQDCWRTRERRNEQDAVRSLLEKMNIRFVEARQNHAETEFCGSTLYREQPVKNARLAPKHYVEQAQGKFLPHTPEEQAVIMQDYCRQFKNRCGRLLLPLLSGRAAAGRCERPAYREPALP